MPERRTLTQLSAWFADYDAESILFRYPLESYMFRPPRLARSGSPRRAF
jgi:hypothetical protein